MQARHPNEGMDGIDQHEFVAHSERPSLENDHQLVAAGRLYSQADAWVIAVGGLDKHGTVKTGHPPGGG